MDIQPRTTVAPPIDQQDWVKSEHGADAPLTGTIDPTRFTLDDDGFIPSGTPIVKNVAGMYVPAIDDEAVAATFVQVAECRHLFKSVRVRDTSVMVGCAVFWHGVVAAELVPVPAGETFDVAKGSAHVLYV